MLQTNVSVVFHSAATVKFDEALRLSVAMNLQGTQALTQLCLNFPKLEVSQNFSLIIYWRILLEQEIYDKADYNV